MIMEYLRSRMQNVCALIAATEAVNEFVRPEAAVNVAMQDLHLMRLWKIKI